MAYTPTEWNCGDTITAEKMNKIAQGIADSGGVLTIWHSTGGQALPSHLPMARGHSVATSITPPLRLEPIPTRSFGGFQLPRLHPIPETQTGFLLNCLMRSDSLWLIGCGGCSVTTLVAGAWIMLIGSSQSQNRLTMRLKSSMRHSPSAYSHLYISPYKRKGAISRSLPPLNKTMLHKVEH